MGSRNLRRKAIYASTAIIFPTGLLAVGNSAADATAATITPQTTIPTPMLNAKVILSGASLKNTFMVNGVSKTEQLTQPDDITRLGSMLYVAFQNNIGPMGQANANGDTASTVVEFSPSGQYMTQWSISGHIDGLTADPMRKELIVTANEDGNSAMSTINPSGASGFQVQHYRYSEVLPHGGGTDSISIYHGQIYVSASAPTVATGPAVYSVYLDWATHVAKVSPVFYDNSMATIANMGATGMTSLALTDPDSNEIVPSTSPRFVGDFVLDSQGDQEQIYVHNGGQPNQGLDVLKLSQSINDTAWATSATGTLYVTDNHNDVVEALSGNFMPGMAIVAVTPCDSNSAPATCPAPGYAANSLGVLNMFTGNITPVTVSGLTSLDPTGLLFEPNA